MARIKKLLSFINRPNEAAERALVLQKAYQDVFNSKSGELVLADIVEQSGLAVQGGIYGADGKTSETDTLIAIGKRDIAIGILRRLHRDTRKIVELINKEIESE